MIRILYVQPYSLECGPNESLLMLLKGLDRTRFLPFVVLPPGAAVCRAYTQLGVEVLIDRGISIVPRSFSPIRQVKYLASACVCGMRLAKLIRQKFIDIVHVNSEACWAGGLAAKLAGVPSISHLRGLSVLSPAWCGYISTWILNHLNNFLIATSYTVEKTFIAFGAKKSILKTIYNGIDTNLFDSNRTTASLRTELAISNNVPLIGMIGHFDARKGHEYFVEACGIVSSKIPGAQFVIVGDTVLNGKKEYFEKINQLAKKFKIQDKLHILGMRKDIANVLASLDIVVQPSLTEAGPRVPIEAMAMKKPVVVSDIGGNSEEVINEQTGIVVAVGDSRGFADAVIKLLNNPLMAKQFGEVGRKRVIEQFSIEKHIHEVTKFYEKVIELSSKSKK